jgi:hypothetical protein
VYWWVPPARRPFLSIILLAFVIALGWVPVVFDWGIISDPKWGAGIMSVVAIWGVSAIAWMYRHNQWR